MDDATPARSTESAPQPEPAPRIRVAFPDRTLRAAQGDADELERVIARELADFRPGAPDRWTQDRCIFRDDRLACVIRRAEDGGPELIRF